MILQSIKYLPKETKQAFLSLISPTALKFTVGTLAVWAGSHLVGVGEELDVLLLGIGYACVGWAAFEGVASIVKSVTLAVDARTEKDLGRAAELFARGLTQLGINTILILLTRKGTRRAAVAEETEVIITRWSIYIDSLDLKFDGSRGALWAKLGELSELDHPGTRAAALAKADRCTTLGEILKHTDFFDRYAAEFGVERNPSNDHITGPIWEMISVRYASLLKGEVTVYTDQLGLHTPIGGKLSAPVLGEELLEIFDRPSVTRVLIKDVTNPSLSLKWNPVDMAKFRGRAPRSGIWH